MKIKIKPKPTTTILGEWVPGVLKVEEKAHNGKCSPPHPRRAGLEGGAPEPMGKAFSSFSPVPVYLRAWSTCVHRDTAAALGRAWGWVRQLFS